MENTECETDSLKMFMGQIPRSMNEEEIRNHLEKYGDIVELVLLRDRNTGDSRGCCFITYTKRECALSAQEALHNKHFFPGMRHPVQMKVADSEVRSDERKLFVGMIPKRFTDSDLRDMFSSYGMIEDSVILTSAEGHSKGCGFVTFASKKSAMNAMQSLHQSKRFDGCSASMVVKVADNSRQRELRKNSFGMDNSKMDMNAAINNINFLNHQYFMQQQFGSQFPPYSSPGDVHPRYDYSAYYGFANQMFPPMTDPTLRPDHSATYSNYQPSYKFLPMEDPAIRPDHSISYPKHQPNVGYEPPKRGAYNASELDQKLDYGPSGSNLFIYYLPQDYSDTDLADIFSTFGRVISAKVFLDKETNKSRCFGFVSYDNHNSASTAIQKMNGFQIGNKRLKVQLKKPKDNRPY